MSTVSALVLREGDRGELERQASARSSSQRQVRRAGIAMMAADGMSNRQIAKVGIDLTQGLFR
jgi:hypothetical protein